MLGHCSIKQTERYCHWDNDHVWPAAMAVCSFCPKGLPAGQHPASLV